MMKACREGGRVAKSMMVALGGNAILRYKDKGTAEEQLRNVRRTAATLVDMVKEGRMIAVTHGNGPQVGDIILKNELAKGRLPMMPVDICGAESQGMIGYMLQQSLRNELEDNDMDIPVATVITQTVVDPNDPSFERPEKPIGPYYTKEEAEQIVAEKGWSMMEEPGRGHRRVLPSPRPLDIIESDIIRKMFDGGTIVIAGGGGGVPVVRDIDGRLKGIEAVVDKDHTAELLATCLGVDTLLILTDVDNAYVDHEGPGRRPIGKIGTREARKLLSEGHFGKGSMRPKVEAAIDFVEAGGKLCIITSPERARDALRGEAGTIVLNDVDIR